MPPVELFKLFGEPTRLAMLLLTMRHGELCVCELMDALDEPQSKVSRHLALLRNAGVLLDQRRGQWVYYRLAWTQDSPEWQLLEQVAASWPDFLIPFEQRMQPQADCATEPCCGA